MFSELGQDCIQLTIPWDSKESGGSHLELSLRYMGESTPVSRALLIILLEQFAHLEKLGLLILKDPSILNIYELLLDNLAFQEQSKSQTS